LVDGDIPRRPPGRLTEIRSGAEGSTGMAEHHHPYAGLLGGAGQRRAQLADQRGRQRVAVVRRIQCDPGDAGVFGVADQGGHQYDRGRPSEVCATKLRIISRLIGAIRASRELVIAAAMPYSLVNPLPPRDCTAWSTARAEASPAAYLAMLAASAAPAPSPRSYSAAAFCIISLANSISMWFCASGCAKP